MPEYVFSIKHEESNSVSVCFNIEADEIMAIGDKMNEIREEAYMNGYNWDAFLYYYLATHHPELLEGMERDPEAGMYIAYYKLTPENEIKAHKIVEIIEYLVANEAKLYETVEKEGEKIEWD